MRRLASLALAATLVLTAAVYWQGLKGPLVFDDATNLSPIAAWLDGKIGLHALVFNNHSGQFGRSLSMASFALNAALTGPGVWGLKLGNLLLHLGNGLLAYALFAALLRCGGCTQYRFSDVARRWLPIAAAALWLLHPLLVSTVLYTVQRMAILSATFMLLGMLLYVRARSILAAGGGHQRTAMVGLLLGVPACTILACLAKENGALTPSLCAVIELCAFMPAPGRQRAWQSRLFMAATLILPAIVAATMVADGAGAITHGYRNQPFTLAERLLTETRVLWSYVGQWIWPRYASMGLLHDDYVLSRGLLHPATTLLAVIAWLAMVAIALRSRRAIPGLALGLGLYLVGHALESTVFPLMIYFEHRNYLPSIGLDWALLSLAAYAVQRLRVQFPGPWSRPSYAAGAAVAVSLILASMTAASAHVWASYDRMLQQALAAHPESAWVRRALIGQALEQMPPDYRSAREYSAQILRSNDPVIQRLGATERNLVDCMSGRTVDPTVIQRMFQGRPEPLSENQLLAYQTLADRLMRQPCHGLSALKMADGLATMMARTHLPPSQIRLWHLHFKTAYLYMHAGRPDQALAQARMAYAGGTSDAQVALFITDMLLRQHDVTGATHMLRIAIAKAPSYDLELQNAIAYYEKAVRTQALHE
ncbi:hypothetical protein QMK61_03030 [Fulvimonas sp. R45]|uniref:hypothetical protein n=1 Tax=Fulvimonas sp. R45 TaxID=3045937 RepID=UPI00265E003E|nr:hypothetical protein [Fulvimonas sp. R45]MDO1527794.1 hypothetical protein [Fulvimonas sp. R45]